MNKYIFQPIQVHETKEMQNFRRGECNVYQNTYLRQADTDGHGLYLPNITIKRETTGLETDASLWTVGDVSKGYAAYPGITFESADPVLDHYELVIFDRGYWGTPGSIPDGDYYLKFSTGPGVFWWSDAFHIVESKIPTLQLNVFPPCIDTPWIKLRWSDPQCVYSGVSDDDQTPVLAFGSGMDYFVYLSAASFVESEWEKNTTYEQLGSGEKVASSRFAKKRWKIKGASVSGAIIDAMEASAFFDLIQIYVAGMDDPIFIASDVIVNSSSPDQGCTYEYEYTFTAGYLSKQGCCP
jgi:hypothetical protein